MKIKLCLFFILCSFILTGCWNYNELNELAIVNGVGIDYEDEKFKVSMMVSNGESAGNSAKDGDSSSTLLVGKGETISEAFQDIESKISKVLYLAHLNILVISDEVAYDSIYPVIDPFFRNPQTIKRYQIVLAKDCKAHDVLNIISPLEAYPSQNIASNIREAENNIGYSSDIILSEFVFNSVNEGIDSVMPSVTISGNKKNADDTKDLDKTYVKTTLELETMGVFDDFKLVGFSSVEESKGINIVNNKINTLIVKTRCTNDEDKYIVSKLDDLKTTFSIKNNHIEFNVSASGSINETNCKLDLVDPNVIKEINKSVSKELKKIVKKSVEFSKEKNSDIFGLKFTALKLKKEFDFDSFDYTIKANVDLKTKGSLENTIKEQKDERKKD